MSSTLDKQNLWTGARNGEGDERKPQKAQKKERVKNGEYEGHMQD